MKFERGNRVRLTRVEIDNFKAVRRLLLENLENVVVLAGPNGCGKSSVFDAIRLWKSAHGGYQENEWQQWFNEFQLRIGSTAILKVLGDKSRSMSISIDVEIAEAEKNWLYQNAESLLRQSAWKRFASQDARSWRSFQQTVLAEDLRQHEPDVRKQVEQELPQLLSELENPVHRGMITIEPDANIKMDTDLVLTKLFSTYEPDFIGVIDYHGPQRSYSREKLSGINLKLDSKDEQKKASALYNYNQKYSNIKSELAAAYVQDLIAQKAGVEAEENQVSLLETLFELFQVFFPGKDFRGVEPLPDGTLSFNVKTAAGEHDIDDLSSGEKEVLYGYLRLRNSAPKNSIVLLDEPELHLNPRLVSGLPDFYYRHLGKALNNQLWLVTHSDALLRQSVGHVGFSVFHVQPPVAGDSPPNQVQEIKAEEEVEQLIIDLVGDLAAYRPGGKLVILEGGGESETDLRIIQDLFPEVPTAVNFISGGSKSRVRDFHGFLKRAKQAGAIPADVASIVDADFEVGASTHPEGTTHQWDRFHIENYLLEPEYILQVMRDLRVQEASELDNAAILYELKECAANAMDSLVRHQLETHCNRVLVSSIRTRSDMSRTDLVSALNDTITASLSRLQSAVSQELSEEALQGEEQALRDRLQSALDDGSWVKKFRGRDILKRFVHNNLRGSIGYIAFRDLIVARMRDAGFKPQGMKTVLEQVVQ